MDLKIAVAGLIDAEDKLRSKEGVDDPSFMSEQMSRLAQYTGAVEQHLAAMERAYERELAEKLQYELIDKEQKVTRAELLAKIALAGKKGEIAYHARLVASAWRQVGVVQSRWNHINKEIAGQT